MIVGFDMYPQMIFKTGVRVVIDNLLSSLRQRYPEHRFVELRPKYGPLSTSRHSYARKIFNHLQRLAWTEIGLSTAARKAGCDVLFCTHMFSPYIQSIPTVTLFYDMAVWRHPEWYPQPWRWINYLFAEIPAHLNIHITTISEDARKDIMEIFGIGVDRVSSIYLGLDMPKVATADDANVLKKYDLLSGAPYILYMGPAIGHKNLPALVAAFGRLTQMLPDQPIYLVIGGPAANTHGKDAVGSIRAAATAAGVADRLRFTGFMPREHVPVLYRNAMIYAFPSLFEGFGLPMIEAMANGTPVVSSDRTSLPEIGGDAAIYFDPQNIEQMAHALYLVATQPNLREEMARRGRERARHFTWERAADAYMQLFLRVRQQSVVPEDSVKTRG